MTLNVIFNTQIKGGSGKTSTLVELLFALSQRYKTGVIDMDAQGAMGSTLLGREIKCLRPSEYLAPEKVTMADPQVFRLVSKGQRITFQVPKVETSVALFPLGHFRDHEDRICELGEALDQMDDPDFLIIDSSGMDDIENTLANSIDPLRAVYGGDINLFPLNVSTPFSNITSMGFTRTTQAIEELIARGFSPNRIFPISVLNKTPIRDRSTYDLVSSEFVDKLIDQGFLSKYPEDDCTGNSPRKVTLEGQSALSILFPEIANLQDGDFSLFLRDGPKYYFYPHLLDALKIRGIEIPIKDEKIQMFSSGITRFIGYVSGCSQVRGKNSHNIHLESFDLDAISEDPQLGYLLERYKGAYSGISFPSIHSERQEFGSRFTAPSMDFISIKAPLNQNKFRRLCHFVEATLAPGEIATFEGPNHPNRFIISLDREQFDSYIHCEGGEYSRGIQGIPFCAIAYSETTPGRLHVGFLNQTSLRIDYNMECQPFYRNVIEPVLKTIAGLLP